MLYVCSDQSNYYQASARGFLFFFFASALSVMLQYKARPYQIFAGILPRIYSLGHFCVRPSTIQTATGCQSERVFHVFPYIPARPTPKSFSKYLADCGGK